jgi:P pilus assembly chaperone PapD
MKIILVSLFFSLNFLFAIAMTPSTLDFNDKNMVSFTLYNHKSSFIGVYFEINKISKDENGNITKEKLADSPFQFNQPLLILSPEQKQVVKLKYFKEIPFEEEVYSISIKEKLIDVDQNNLNLIHNIETKIFVGGVIEDKPYCKIENKTITIINPNSKHIYLNKQKIFIDDIDISSDLKDKKVLGYYLPKKSKNKRDISILGKKCEIK